MVVSASLALASMSAMYWAADGRGCVEQHDAVVGGQERGLVDPVGDPVQVPLHAPDVVALVVEGRAERGPGDRRVVGQCW
jgi:hypothetical protein